MNGPDEGDRSAAAGIVAGLIGDGVTAEAVRRGVRALLVPRA